MQIHHVKREHPNKKKKTIGRGGSRGTYSGKGVKGQKARAGRKMRPEIRDIIKKIPKKRGYRFASIGEKPTTIAISTLQRFFSSGDSVTPRTLAVKGIIKKTHGGAFHVKIVGGGTLEKKLIISGCRVSKGARKEIEKNKGTIGDK